ncbi:hypothetical protein TIFTF001_000018 [Ficus carica]|uniref:Uncharacterized protein n=1 Tax=Ficus carica TaxID=3494 RepID=A0AA87Z7S5_FICCA|nr:hypothetical protein TIFTF001_000018 [Ficus carica]
MTSLFAREINGCEIAMKGIPRTTGSPLLRFLLVFFFDLRRQGGCDGVDFLLQSPAEWGLRRRPSSRDVASFAWSSTTVSNEQQ